MRETINVKIIPNGTFEVKKGASLLELAREHAGPSAIVAKVDSELRDLCLPVTHDCEIEFIDAKDPNGFRTYQRSVSFLMIYAAKSVLGRKTRVVIAHSINKNYYCELPDLSEPVNAELLHKIEAVMREAVAKKLKIEKHSLPLEQAFIEAENFGLQDKVRHLKYRRTSSVNFYKLDWLYDYFYGQMAPDTELLGDFKMIKRSRGFMLFFTGGPETERRKRDVEVEDRRKRISDVLEESRQWAQILKVDTVGALNDKLCQTGSGEIIRVAEALHEKKIGLIADKIAANNKTIALIAGPSSSGKTTFASRLAIQLRVNGMRPSVISLDNYYLDRELIPRDENGNYDFETIDAIDTKQIDSDLRSLLAGNTVEIPHFNFLTGKREYKGNFLRLTPGDVLLIEGIHGLNERVSEGVPRHDKFKIFISALTQINVDDHNRIPTSDTRLVRRITRDFQFRGFTAERTIAMWPSVLRGEGKYIFPYQEEADAFFNSTLVYEMCVLKQYVEPLLFWVKEKKPERTEAMRLIKFLDCFLGVSSEGVPNNSILREFIGGGCF